MKNFYLTTIATVAMAICAFSAEIPRKCPLQDFANKTVHIAHESDCTKFYKCQKGAKHEMRCPTYSEGEALCFNPSKEICDWPRNVPCCKDTKTPIDPHCPPPGNDTNVVWAHPSMCNVYFTCKNGAKSLRSCDKGDIFDTESLECRPSGKGKCNKDIVCPPAGSKESVILPHECDCTKYYECVNGEATRKQCPANMKFDYIRKECIATNEAVCNTEPGMIISKPKLTPAPIKCPASGITDVSNEADCSSYYRCENGVARLEQCIGGFYFDEIMGMCTWWENVDCGVRAPIEYVMNIVSSMECSSDKSSENMTLQHECSCEKYYVCKDAEAVLQRCEEGSAYDHVRQVCDNPEVVQCERPELTTTLTNTPTDPLITVSLLTTLQNTCPATGYIKLPYPGDCTKYIECRNGRGTPGQCLENHYFNPTISECDLIPAGKDCRNPTTTTTTTTTPTPIPTLSPECPAADCKGILRMPYRGDCSSYWECVDGRKVKKTCRKGLKFDKVTLMCDLESYVKCDDNPYICTPDTPNNQKVPHDCDCSLYYICENGESVRQECPEGTSYDYIIQQCVLSYLARCYIKP